MREYVRSCASDIVCTVSEQIHLLRSCSLVIWNQRLSVILRHLTNNFAGDYIARYPDWTGVTWLPSDFDVTCVVMSLDIVSTLTYQAKSRIVFYK